MRAAAAFEAGEPVADLPLRRVRRFRQQRGRGHDPAVEAIAALRHLLGDEGRLHLVRLLGGADAVERGDRLAGDENRLDVTQERVGTPLMRTVQAPHCASPQPKRGLLMPRSSRKA